MTTLISFLGKGKEAGKNYRQASYRFADQTRTTTFFGMALAKYLNPARLILVGTSGSMWDVFFENDAGDDAALLDLIEAVPQSAVTAAMLATHTGRLSEKLGYQVECLLIDYARDEKGQIDLLDRLANKLSENEHIALDITHSFRHLPMLALVAARFLTRVKNIKVEDIYYGALEMTESDQITPVIHLKGLLDLLDWVDALASYDKDGDYGVFSALLINDGMPEDRAKALQQASFLERVNHVAGACQQLGATFKAIDTHPGLMGKLFKEELENRIQWARKPDRAQRELALAEKWFDRRDYMRTAIFLLEGLITRELSHTSGGYDDHAQRDETRKRLDKENALFKQLDRLRNALAHGKRSPDKEINRLLNDEVQLRSMLEQCFKKLT
ncbi:MAG: TIGR02221 family CRISPR-associated protein [Azoarcus sp.]|jgi:CRISPR-associated Csx2 family protein|nr:TIGR02221 family CRISPR-associated protein [Azoarcus sp.]